MTSTTHQDLVREGFAALLREAPVLLSGAMGTELERRGAPTPLPLWSTAAMEAHPELVRHIHAEYVDAGARLITANTFRTDRWTLAKVGRSNEARPLTALAVRLAREGVAMARPKRAVMIAGSIAPLEDCYEPDRVPDADTLRIEHAVRVGNLVAAGAPCAWIETMNTIREAVAALDAARAGALPAGVSFVCDADGNPLSGEPIEDAAEAVESLDPLAICVNCCSAEAATKAALRLLDATERPVGVYANGRGRPDDEKGWVMRGGTNDRAYARAARQWVKKGVKLVGGCCGTSPKTIARIRSAVFV